MRNKILPIIYIVMMLSFSFLIAPTQAQNDIIEFPELTGAYSVGRTTYHMIDDSREEIFTVNENDNRELLITVFYPALPDAGAELAPYVEDILIPPIVEATEIPAFVWEGFQSHSYLNVPIVDSNFPVILFSHGLGEPITEYTGQMEDLASHGYIVVGISHTYVTSAITLSDGRTVTPFDSDIYDTFASISSEEEMMLFFNYMLDVWVDDVVFVLDELDYLNTTDDLLNNHLDLSRIGAIGHSFGGATVLETAFEDERILAAINMDGSMSGDVLEYGLTLPTMIMKQDIRNQLEIEGAPPTIIESELEANTHDNEAVLGNATPGYSITLFNSAHMTYATDLLIMAENFPILARSDLVGTIDDFEEARLNIHNTVLAFFNTYIAQVNSPQMTDLTFEGFEITTFNID